MRKLRPIVALALVIPLLSVVGAQVETTKVAQTSLAASLAKVQKAIDDRHYAEALKQGNALVAAFPKRWEGYRLVGRAAFGLDLPVKAETSYRQALRLAPMAIQASLKAELGEVTTLRSALKSVARAESLRALGDDDAAAEAQERAYHALPSRYAYGLAAVALFEEANLLEDASRLLLDLQKNKLPASVAVEVKDHLATLTARIQAAHTKEADEAARKQSEKDRRAADAERKRIDAERQAETDRQKAEKTRLDKEETDRLTGILNDQKSAVSDAEGAVNRLNGSVDDAQRSVNDADREANDARGKRDRASGEKSEWQGKVNDAKNEIAKEVAREGLRNAEHRYDSAKNEADHAEGRLNDARSHLNGAKSDADDARKRLDLARAALRDTEEAISRLANGS